MAVCKKCGCAIPLGNKSCDICATLTAIAPSQPSGITMPTQPQTTWSPSTQSSVAPTWSAPQPSGLSAPTPAPIEPAAVSVRPASILMAEKQIRSAWHWLAIVGIMYLVLGGLADLGYLGDIDSLFGGWGLAVGASFLVLAFFVRQGSIIAMGIAIAIYTAYTLAFFAAGSYAFMRILVLAWLLRAFLAMYTVRQHRRAQAQQPTASDQTRAA